MSDSAGKTVWRVRAHDDAVYERAFDALVLMHDMEGPESRQRHLGLAVPFEDELPNLPLTLTVQARPAAGPLVVEYMQYEPDGSLHMGGRCFLPLAVIVSSAAGLVVTGIPAAELESPAPAT